MVKSCFLDNDSIGKLIDKYYGAPYHHRSLSKNPYVGDGHVEPDVADFKSKMFSLNKLDYDFSGKSCAIIGGSPNLLNNKYGKFIDSFDFVVRLNEATIDGLEQYCGEKTDFRIISKKTFTFLRDANYAKLFPNSDWKMFTRFPKQHYLIRPWSPGSNEVGNYKSILDSLQQYYYKDDYNISFVNHNIEKEATKLVNGKLQSTGFLAIYLFCMLFEKIDIFGFDFHNEGKGVAKYYFSDKYTAAVSNIHNFSLEKKICKDLEKKGRLKIHE